MPHRPCKAVLLLGSIFLSCTVFFLCPVLAQFPGRGGPPWEAPVESTHKIRIGGATLQVDFGPGPLDPSTAQVMEWIDHAATAVATYYGRFPVPRDRILIEPRGDNRGITHGTTWGDVGGFPAFTRIGVGQHTPLSDFNDDWMMTHELVHTAFPSQEELHHWIEEGLAVYVEPVARVQAGYLRPEKIWSDMMRDMPQGDPPPGDEGLDRTRSWGLTYWGGAQFCLLADVTIREQTHNRKGLQDALRGIVDAGGTIDQNWPILQAFRTGDAATGTHVLEEQYKRMADHPVAVDLDGIWKRLGAVRTQTGIRLDDTAPEAKIRLAITRSPVGGPILPQQ
jgi:hypothetical protein